jgi:LmbE family N-acetylglucosaminyl deacetylase
MQDIFIPDGKDAALALRRTTHLGLGAHQDDLEIMAFHGIAECYRSKSRWFTGVTCTDGASSPRSGARARVSNEAMIRVRTKEQRKAAQIGKYGAMIQLGLPSSDVKDRASMKLENELKQLFEKMSPRIIYTHNLADRHDTHVAVVLTLLRVLISLPEKKRPKKVYGCEVWRSLDWLPDEIKVGLDVSGNQALARKLLQVFRSQIRGGKRYDLATLGRRRANATYHQPRTVDTTEEMIFAIDLTPLLTSQSDPASYMKRWLEQFQLDVLALL